MPAEPSMKPRYRKPDPGYTARHLSEAVEMNMRVLGGNNAAFTVVDKFEDGAIGAARRCELSHRRVFYIVADDAKLIVELVRDALTSNGYLGVEVSSRKVPENEQFAQLNVLAHWPFPGISPVMEEDESTEEDDDEY